jgi:phage tail sheath protein FI
MPEYLSPGVYVEEVDTGNKPIEGVATSTVGFFGVAERGPLDATLVTSFSEYVRNFGRYVPNRYLARGVEGFFQNGGKRCYIARVTATGATPANATNSNNQFTITALGLGTWPNNRLAFKVSPAGQDVQNPNLFRLTVMYWDSTVSGLPAPANVIDPTDPLAVTDPNRRNPTILESFDNLSTDPLAGNFFEREINGVSVLVKIARVTPNPAPARPANQPALPAAGARMSPPIFFTNGADGANNGVPVAADFLGDPTALPGQRRGLLALEDIDEIAILCCPDESAFPANIPGAVIEQCERLKDRFAILQSQQGPVPVNNLQPSVISKYGGFYYPWIRIPDPLTGMPLDIPPGGHIAGIYARSDIERGVHKAPANEVIRGLYLDPADPAAGLTVKVNKGQQDILNPKGVNVLRNFPGRGNLVWGARTSTLDPDWKYINVRRLFIFVEESIDEATQWVVFEPNDEPLWARVRRSVGDFLTRLWMDGMLQGKSKEEAYFVRCDRTTMTQADIDNGKLIMLIGIAPVKPAEFVIFRIGQWTGGSDVTEG